MTKEILVCLEGSRSCADATDVAITLGSTLSSTLVGLAVVDEPDIVAGQATSIGGASYKKDRDQALLEDAHEHARQWLLTFTARCQSAGVPSKSLELSGRPADTILEEMQRHDLTVLGRHANFLFETKLQDHQTRDRILRRANKPVMVVPESPRDAGPTVLVAYDGSAAANRALSSFAQSGLVGDRPIHIATVGDDGASAWEMAARGCEILRQLGIKASAHSLVSTLPVAEAILDRRARLSASLIVLGAYVRSRLSQLLWGSVTRELLEKTVVPLYLHH